MPQRKPWTLLIGSMPSGKRRASLFAVVDLALHVGEVLYGNVGAVDRLDFTVIGPAVNEVARIETLCEPLGRKLLISAELASVVGDRRPLEPLGYHTLRGVREPRQVYALDLESKANKQA